MAFFRGGGVGVGGGACCGLRQGMGWEYMVDCINGYCLVPSLLGRIKEKIVRFHTLSGWGGGVGLYTCI